MVGQVCQTCQYATPMILQVGPGKGWGSNQIVCTHPERNLWADHRVVIMTIDETCPLWTQKP